MGEASVAGPLSIPVPSNAELIGRASEIAPRLIGRQAETEQRTHYAEDTHEAFRRAGFYRMLVPRAFGGFEIDLATYHRVIVEICSGCPSTGWQLCLGTIHTFIASALFDESVQAELFGDGDFICAATTRPQGVARREDGSGWGISGTFNYASGIPYATHFMSHALPIGDDGAAAGAVMTFVAPRNAWEPVYDWGNALGLKGSGSHSVAMRDAAVPQRFVVEQMDMLNLANGGAPHFKDSADRSIARHARLLSQFSLGPAAMLVGMLKGALTEYERLLSDKKTTMPPILPCQEHEDYRRWAGLGAGKLAMAEAALDGLSHQWHALAKSSMERGEPFTAEDDLRLSAASAEIGQLAWDAMQDIIWTTSGTSSAMDGTVMQRIFRDMATARTHLSNVIIDGLRRDLGSQLFRKRT